MKSCATVFYDDFIVNPYVGAGALGQCIDDFNGDNFDWAGLGFIRGGHIARWQSKERPIEHHPVPKGTPKFDAGWKQVVLKNDNHAIGVGAHGAVMRFRGNHLDLDPTCRDAYGRPPMRMTFDHMQNEIAMPRYLTDGMAEIARVVVGREGEVSSMQTLYNNAPYQTTHNTKGHIMGDNPSTSVTNRYNQSWNLPNLFPIGGRQRPAESGLHHNGNGGGAGLSLDASGPRKLPARPRPDGAGIEGLWLALSLAICAVPVSAQDAKTWSTVQRGLYLSRVGDGAAPHTIDGDEPMADGLGLLTPFGTVYAPNLTPDGHSSIGDWSDEELADDLRHGRDDRTAAFGPMEEVVETSTRWLTDNDLNAIVAYVKDLPSEQPNIARQEPVGADDPAVQRGSLIYAVFCLSCHGPNGECVENQFGRLAGSSLTQSEKYLTVVLFILKGVRAVLIGRYPTPDAVPAFDRDVADVATYLRHAVGNVAFAVSGETVADIRQ